MTLGILVINIFVGVLFVLIWGVLSYVASSETEFKSFFFGGLANFVFFIGGVLASYLSSLIKPVASPATQPVAQKNGFSVMVSLYVAIATICANDLTNIFSERFTNSLGRLERLGTISFQPDGYRDIQIYAGRDCVAHAQQQPISGGVQDQTHLIGPGRAARCAVGGESGVVHFDQVSACPRAQ